MDSLRWQSMMMESMVDPASWTVPRCASASVGGGYDCMELPHTPVSDCDLLPAKEHLDDLLSSRSWFNSTCLSTSGDSKYCLVGLKRARLNSNQPEAIETPKRRTPGRPKGSKDTKPRKRKDPATKQQPRASTPESPASGDSSGRASDEDKAKPPPQQDRCQRLSFIDNLHALLERRRQAVAAFEKAKSEVVCRSKSDKPASPSPPAPSSAAPKPEVIYHDFPAFSAAAAAGVALQQHAPEIAAASRAEDPFHSDWPFW